MISTLALCWWAFGLGSFATEYHLLQLNLGEGGKPRRLDVIIFGALFTMLLGPMALSIRSTINRDGKMVRCSIFGIVVYDAEEE